jgi:nitroreductase
MSVFEAVDGRKSIRRFRPDPVPEALVRDILARASRAASGANIQPWLVRVVTGQTRARLVSEVQAAFYKGETSRELRYYPEEWFSPYLDRRRECGLALYQLLGLTRDNKSGMKEQHARNYAFFDAPVGLFFTIDRRLTQGSLLDMGMFIATIMLVARAHGLETCPQLAWGEYAGQVHKVLEIPQSELLVCGMALGYEAADCPENTLRTSRVGVDSFTTFLT